MDYSSFTWSAILAAQAMALNSDLELGSGIVGYGRHYWRTFTDGVLGPFSPRPLSPRSPEDFAPVRIDRLVNQCHSIYLKVRRPGPEKESECSLTNEPRPAK